MDPRNPSGQYCILTFFSGFPRSRMTAPTPRTERRFYAEDHAIGRFGMRIFPPSLMAAPHWHGHVEANFLSGASMTYLFEGRRIEVPAGRLALFWANLPHQLVAIAPEGPAVPRLANLYIPFDRFLLLPHVARLQAALLSGAVAVLDPAVVGAAQVEGWYRDYRSGHAERREILFMELNAALRRSLLDGPELLLEPDGPPGESPAVRAAARGHIVAMVRFVLENLTEPLRNADVAAVTGLHESYALSLFSRVMGVPVRRFVIRMRLLRARAELLESGATVAEVALRSGFQGPSQFYDHFRRAYGVTPQGLRQAARAIGSIPFSTAPFDPVRHFDDPSVARAAPP